MYLFVRLVILVIAAITGLLLFLYPTVIIEIQKKIYENHNLRIDPISMPKMVRNIRMMGVLILVFIVVRIIMFFMNPSL